MLSSIAAPVRHEITTFAELRRRAQPLGPKRVAIVVADDEVALTAADGALHLGIAIPVLIGNERKIRAQAEALGLSELLAAAEFVSSDNAAAVATQMAREGRVNILLVEDHGQSLLATARLIRGMGHAVRTASGVVTATALLNSETFDLLLADIELPDGTGWELMKIARAVGPIVGLALSGHGGDEDIAKSLEAGFAQHLVKPITYQRLIHAIEEAAPGTPTVL